MARPKYPSDKQAQFMLRLPDGMRERLKETAAENGRSMNAEIVERLEASEGHPNTFLIRAMINLHEKFLTRKEELKIDPGVQDEIHNTAVSIGLSAQQFLSRLIMQSINHLNMMTDLGKQLEKEILEQYAFKEGERPEHPEGIGGEMADFEDAMDHPDERP
jgi:predicted HicB family RNase H-like nuclease